MDTVKTTSRGRPVDPELQKIRKNCLLDAVEELLEEKSYRTITIRDIAARADMKSAMIGYYFGSKDQLFVALLKRISDLSFKFLKTSVQHEDTIKGIISMALHLFSTRPFMARLLTDEIIQNDSPIRDAFIQMLPGHGAKVLPALIKQEQDAGRIRKDLDPKRLAFSLVSMLVLPFIGAPFRRIAWGFSDEEVVSDEWADHIYQLFMAGAANNEE